MRMQKRRRQEAKTNYLKRLNLLKSKAPRMVLRKTNRYLIVQYIESKNAQDSVKFGMDSRKLMNYGWSDKLKGSLKSVTAAYALGMLSGKKIVDEKLVVPIADFGLYRVLPKTKIHAFLNGLSDSGLKIKVKKENFPEEERKKGKHLKNFNFEEIKSKIMGKK